MNHRKTRIHLARVLGVLVAIMALQGLAGCGGGAEPQKPLAAPDPKQPPGGGSVDDYKAHMGANANKK